MNSFNALSFTVKGKCVKGAYFPAENPHSVVIAKSEFPGLIATQDVDPSILLSILHKQFPKSADIVINRTVPQGCNDSRSYRDYIEIVFNNRFLRQMALIEPFRLQDRVIRVHRTTHVPNGGNLYHVFISNIQSLKDPSTYWKEVFTYLEEFGIVDSLHLHSTTDEGFCRHNGDGCAMVITLPNRIKNISSHPVFKISYKESPSSS
ncbi:hypothetical protein [Parasitella parasitica]|uniref:Uncharacterized protein n=1 Tax=Parasitella parasitica TaxID=35722 RepID=A0A0B7NC05_9FUNG|nr:hypothetical protein [Parasitella parasitica]